MKLSTIDQFRAIVDSKSVGKVDGVTVDLFSASAVVAVHDGLSEDFRPVLLSFSVPKIVDVFFKVLNKAADHDK